MPLGLLMMLMLSGNRQSMNIDEMIINLEQMRAMRDSLSQSTGTQSIGDLFGSMSGLGNPGNLGNLGNSGGLGNLGNLPQMMNMISQIRSNSINNT